MSHSAELTISRSFEVLPNRALTSATGGVDVSKRQEAFDKLKKVIKDYEGTEKSVIDQVGR